MKNFLISYLLTALNMIMIMLVCYYPLKWIFRINKMKISLLEFYYITLASFLVV